MVYVMYAYLMSCALSGFGCHYLHLHKGVCQSDQYLEGCRIYKPLANGVSLSKSPCPFFHL